LAPQAIWPHFPIIWITGDLQTGEGPARTVEVNGG
jgi:hypothetical protein